MASSQASLLAGVTAARRGCKQPRWLQAQVASSVGVLATTLLRPLRLAK